MVLNDSLILDIAGLPVLVRFRYPEFRAFCGQYILADGSEPVFEGCATEDQIKEEMKWGSETEADAESLCIYRAIAEKLPFYNRFVMHGASIAFDGKAYIFTAASGTGKTTHIKLWRYFLGDYVSIVNGDKPVIELRDDCCLAYGTPWAGKERWQRRVCAPVNGICFLDRGEENSVRKISPSEALIRTMHQIYLPKTEDAARMQLDLADRFLGSVPLYLLSCNISAAAVRCSFEAMTGKKFDDYKIREEL